jgi:hypothetical protein
MDTLIKKIETLTNESKYQQATELVANAFNFTVAIEFLKNDFHFTDDTTKRDIYKITIERGSRKYSFEFGQSIAKSMQFEGKLNKRRFTSSGQSAGNHSYRYLYPEKFPKTKFEERYGDFKIIEGEAPTLYDVLACLQKYDVGTFDDFCHEFGYDTDSRKAKKTYKAVLKEYNAMCKIFNSEELEVLSYIF